MSSSNRRPFLRLAGMIKTHKGLLAASVFFGLTGNLSSIGLLVFSAAAAAEIVAGNSCSFPVLPVAAAVICGLARGVLRYGEHYFGHDIAFRLLFDIRKQIFAVLNTLAPAKLLDRSTGDISTAVMSDVEYIETFFAHTLAPIIIGTVVPLIVLLVLSAISPWFALLMLPFYLLMGLLVPILSFKSAAADGREYREKLSGMNSRLTENLQGLRELMLFNRDGERLDELLEATEDCSSSYRRIRANEGLLAGLVEVIILAAAASVIALGAVLVSRNLIGIEGLVSAVVISLSSFGPLISLMFLSNSLVNTSAAAERIFELIDEEPAVKNPGDEGGSCISGFRVDVPPAAECVDFTYPGTDKKIFDGLELELDTGMITALKGESGRGKSTILYLMMRFFDPQSGRMSVGGDNLKSFDLDKLRSGISYFTQDTTLFNISVMENIRMARGTAGDDDVYLAAKKAGIHSFISGLPEGYDTPAGERGSRFSSGERQRIGLARIFLQNNNVILLDEPVSNLDSENERLIMENLKNGLQGRSVVLVSHRSSVVQIADQVIEI